MPVSDPKAWSPRQVSLLTKEERVRLALIKENDGHLTIEDKTWLIATLERLSKLSPLDFDFPDHVALVNHMAGNAYILRYRRSPSIKRRHEIDQKTTSRLVGLLEATINLSPTDALLIVRPYFVFHGTEAEALRSVGMAELALEIDGFEVFRSPIEDHLVFQDGRGMKRKPFSFHAGISKDLFEARRIDTGNPGSVVVPTEILEQGETLGLFVVNETKVILSLISNCSFEGSYRVTAGLVAAEYTTKAEGQ